MSNKAKVKRIFICGAPGSMWSTIDRWLRVALHPHIDNSDITPERRHEGHIGAYWNPGNEPSWDWILNFGEYDRDHIIETLDSAYADPIPDASEKDFIIRTYKSHYFTFHYDKLVELFPEADIIVSLAEPHIAFLWWEYCGGHDTVFNDYKFYNRSYKSIWNEIVEQTKCTKNFIKKYHLNLEYYNTDFIRKYYAEPSRLMKRRLEDQMVNSDHVDNLMGISAKGSGIGGNTRAAIYLGTDRLKDWL